MNNLTIVMYHYVRDLKRSRYPEIKGLDLDLFKEQLAYLKKHYCFVTAQDVMESIESNRSLPPHAVLLTFDDAYLDHYTQVFPLLDKMKIQGSFYVPAKAIEEHALLDVNKIHFILASVADKKSLLLTIRNLINQYREEYNLESYEYYEGQLAIASRFDSADVMFIKNLLQYGLVEELRIKMADALFERHVGLSQEMFSRELYMTKEQIMTMQRNGMHIGCHGYNHYWWDKLSSKEMQVELDRSWEFLLDVGVKENEISASYPYGVYNQQAIEGLANKGCKYALTTEVGIADVSKTSRYLLPRLDTNDIPKSSDAAPNEWFKKLYV